MGYPHSLHCTESKHGRRHLNSTDNPELDAFAHSSSFTFVDDFQRQSLLETKHPPFHITKLNTFHYGAFTNFQLVINYNL